MGVILTAAHCQQLSSLVPPQARLEVPAKLPPPYQADYCPAAQVALSPTHPELSASAGGVRDDRAIDLCSITCAAATCGVLVTDAPGTSRFGLLQPPLSMLTVSLLSQPLSLSQFVSLCLSVSRCMCLYTCVCVTQFDLSIFTSWL